MALRILSRVGCVARGLAELIYVCFGLCGQTPSCTSLCCSWSCGRVLCTVSRALLLVLPASDSLVVAWPVLENNSRRSEHTCGRVERFDHIHLVSTCEPSCQSAPASRDGFPNWELNHMLMKPNNCLTGTEHRLSA